VREIRTHRSMWRELETESRTGLRHRQSAKAVGNSYSPGLRITAPVPDPTEDEEPLVGKGAVERINEVPADLQHPRFTWAGCDSSEVDAACSEFDHEEHVERNKTTRCPDFDREEVGSGKHASEPDRFRSSSGCCRSWCARLGGRGSEAPVGFACIPIWDSLALFELPGRR
jgi:hypothetical protein